MHNDTSLGLAMYFKELDRQLAPTRPGGRIVARRVLEATGSVFRHGGEFARKIGIWPGNQGNESSTDAPSKSQPARAGQA
jgi:hypothetical protein